MLPSTKLRCRLKLFYLRVSIRLAMTSKDLNAQNLISQEELTCCAAFPLSSSDGFPVVSAYCREDDGPASETLTLPFFWIHLDAPQPIATFRVPTSILSIHVPTSILNIHLPTSILNIHLPTSILNIHLPTSILNIRLPTSILNIRLPTSILKYSFTYLNTKYSSTYFHTQYLYFSFER